MPNAVVGGREVTNGFSPNAGGIAIAVDF